MSAVQILWKHFITGRQRDNLFSAIYIIPGSDNALIKRRIENVMGLIYQIHLCSPTTAPMAINL